MIILDKYNSRVQLFERTANANVVSKDTFYTDYKICLALEGSATWKIGDKSYQILPGDIILLNIGQKRRFTAFGDKGFRLCAFVMSRNAFSKPHHFLFFRRCIRNQQNVIRNSGLSELLRQAYHMWSERNPFRYEFASAKLTEFFIQAELAEGQDRKTVSQTDLEMLEIMDYIDENITKQISLSLAAKHGGVSESAFSRRFSRWNGVSFKQYVIDKKIQHSIQLLETTQLKMIDIAMESGFESVSGFYDAFRKKTGTTPGEYIRGDG